MNNLYGKVAKVVDEYTVVINLGCADGVTFTDRFLIYNMGEEILDPETGKSLGRLEIVCGEGKPSHIQDKMTTLTSSIVEIRKTKVIRHVAPLFSGATTEETLDPEEIQKPFLCVELGSLVKEIN